MSKAQFSIDFRKGLKEVLRVAEEQRPQLENIRHMYIERINSIKADSIGRFSSTILASIDYRLMTHYLMTLIQRTTEFKCLEQVLSNYALVKRHLTKPGVVLQQHEHISTFGLVQNILAYYASINNTYLYNEELCNKILNDLNVHFGKRYMEKRYYAYLENCLINAPFTINREIIITPLTRNEVASVFNTSATFRSLYNADWKPLLQRVNAVIQISIKSNKSINGIKFSAGFDKEQEGKIKRLLDCIRASVPVEVNTSPIIVSLLEYPYENHEYYSGSNSNYFYNVTTQLDKDDIYRIGRLFKRIERGKREITEIELILRRLSMRATRYNFEDTVLDLFICLELIVNAYLPRKSRPRLNSETMAVLISKIVGGNKLQRKKDYEAIKGSYRIRNSIIHANNSKVDDKTPIYQAEKIMRLLLRRLILKNQKQNFRKKTSEWML